MKKIALGLSHTLIICLCYILETLSYCVLINFHTTPTNWLTDWLTGGWLADWLTDYSAYQLTDQLTGLLFQLLTSWLPDWLTVWLIDWLTYWQQYSSQIIETKPVFLNFWKILYIHSSHLCCHSNVPLSFPNVEPRVFWSTETTVIPKSTLGKGKITQVFQDLWRVL